MFDRIGSVSLGRPCCVREEESVISVSLRLYYMTKTISYKNHPSSFDLDLPLEVDDEYWIPNDPSQPAFKQPTGKPSIISGFVSFLKITHILAYAMRTIVSPSNCKI